MAYLFICMITDSWFKGPTFQICIILCPECDFPTVYSLPIVGWVLIAIYWDGSLEYIGDGVGNQANAHTGPPTKKVGVPRKKLFQIYCSLWK